MYVIDLTAGLYPDVSKVDIGSSVKFTCARSQYVKWSFNGEKLPPNCYPFHIGIRPTLEIFGVQLYNAGYYECIGQTKQSLFLSRSQLLVYGI